jgi:hypothetical protein
MRRLFARAAATLLLACFPLTCHLAPAILGVAAPDAAEAATDELSALSAEYAHRLKGLDPDGPGAWRLLADRRRGHGGAFLRLDAAGRS